MTVSLHCAIPASSGYLGKVINAGIFENKGLEVLLRLTPVDTKKGLRWDISFTYTKNTSLVKEILSGLDQISLNVGQALFSCESGNSFTGGAIVLQKVNLYGSLLMTSFERDPNSEWKHCCRSEHWLSNHCNR